MSYEQPSKPKKKNSSGSSIHSLIKPLFLLVLLLICISPLIVGGRAYLQYYAERHDFSMAESAATCEQFSLPSESDFCKSLGFHTVEDLTALLTHTYPPYVTSLADLQAQFRTELGCQAGTTECSVSVPKSEVYLLIFHNGTRVTRFEARNLADE